MKRVYMTSVIALLSLSILAMTVVPVSQATDDFPLRVTKVFWGTNLMMPETAFVGEENKPLTVMLVNSGAEHAFDVRATLYLEYPFQYSYIDQGRTFSARKVTSYAGIVLAGNFSLLTFNLDIAPDAKEGTFRIQIQLEYEDALGAHQWRLRSIDVMVYGPGNSLIVQDIHTTPVKVHPGDTLVTYLVSIYNDGKSPYKDVSAELRLSDPFQPSSSSLDRIFLGTIASEQGVEASFTLDVAESASPGAYSLELILTHFPFVESISTYVPLVINEKAHFSVIIEPSSVFAAEDEVVVTVSVRNLSEDTTADGVWATLKAGNLFEGTTADYLGILRPGENKTASFILDIDSKANGSYLFDLDIDWTQEDKEFDESLLVKIEVTQKQLSDTLSGETLYYAGGGLLLICLFGLVIVIRRRRRKQR